MIVKKTKLLNRFQTKAALMKIMRPDNLLKDAAVPTELPTATLIKQPPTY